ncbi:MAG TPA: DEAD/DEAH box helicase [Phycisphaerales bacterium]|nr:DEAD/DEAH box helicase [Phycisphaerales bacterium]
MNPSTAHASATHDSGHHHHDHQRQGPPDMADPSRRKRRRRGRGGRGGGGDGDHHGDGHRGGGGGAHPDQQNNSAASLPARVRAPRQPSSEEWEEIFNQQTFTDLGLRNSVVKGCEEAGFKHPTKIQAQLIPMMLSGKDVLGQSRTGTGKTAAFGLPLYHSATRDLPFQSIILAPTRELALQIAAELADLGKFTPIRVSAVYGGQQISTQARQLDAGPEILVATPGRLMDMKERGYLHFNNVKSIVLDEVDRMLDIGFRDDIKKILSQIKSAHQTIFVSATISEEIERLARSFMKDPEKIVTTGGSLTVSLVEQHYISIEPWDKRRMLVHLLTHEDPDLTVVFCRTKRTVDDLATYLRDKGVDAHAIHGDMYQGKRNSVMNRLRTGQLGVLVASDLAARGLDVDGISHVVNYDLPEDPEIYIHRIGRTARAGRGGVAWSLVTPEQGPLLTEIEKLANTHVPEKQYPDFQPGPIPTGVRAQRDRDQQMTEAKRQTFNRFAPAAAPVKAATPAQIDTSKFPGGFVPTKLPPKKLGGRIKTSRSMRLEAPPPVPAPDAAQQNPTTPPASS